MSSVMGIISQGPLLSTRADLGSMLAATYRQPSYVESTYCSGDGCFSIAKLTHQHSKCGVAGTTEEEGTSSLTLFGDVYDLPKSKRNCGSESDYCQTFLAGFVDSGAAFLNHVHGTFIAVVSDETRGLLQIANDRFGQRPLYYAVRDGVLYFATSPNSLAAVGIGHDISASGLSQFFTFGYNLGCDTMMRDVSVLPAGTILTFDARAGSIELVRYAASNVAATSPKSDRDWIDQICDATVNAVRRASRDTDGLGLALSGGLDARTILGLVDHDSTDLKTICLGMEGSLDLRCAQQMADIVGCQHHSHVLDASFLDGFEQHLNTMVELTGGQYLSQCIVIPTLPIYREQGVKVLLRGHAGELMHMSKAYALSMDDAALGITTCDQAHDWIFGRLQAHMLDNVEGGLFAGEYNDAMQSAPREAFRAAFDAIPETDDPRQTILHMFVNERLRRETMLSMQKFASVCDVRVPLLDPELVDLLLAAPVDLKLDETLQREILRRHRPELLQVINANVGAPMTSGPMTRKISKFKMRVLSKLGVRGYQPYERMGLWLRRELDPLVRRTLLNEQCLDRRVFNPDAVRRIIDDHQSRSANHTFLLLAMLVFEVGQRRLQRAA